MRREDIRLAGPHEVAAILGVSRQWAAQISQRKTFPEPIAELRIGNVWLVQDVEEWAARNPRKKDEPGQ